MQAARQHGDYRTAQTNHSHLLIRESLPEIVTKINLMTQGIDETNLLDLIENIHDTPDIRHFVLEDASSNREYPVNDLGKSFQ